MYRMMIKLATWLAGAGFFAFFVLLLAARSDGPSGVEIPPEFQRLTIGALILLGVLAGAGAIAEINAQRQQAAMLQHLTRFRDGLKRDLGVFLKDEVTVWITRCEAHGRARLVDELTEVMDDRLTAAVQAAAKQAYQDGDKNGFARGVGARASVPANAVPSVLGSNVLRLAPAPRGGEE